MQVNLDIIREGVTMKVACMLEEHFDKPPKMSEHNADILKQFTEACIDFVMVAIDVTKIETHEDVEKCTQQFVDYIYNAIRCILGQYTMVF